MKYYVILLKKSQRSLWRINYISCIRFEAAEIGTSVYITIEGMWTSKNLVKPSNFDVTTTDEEEEGLLLNKGDDACWKNMIFFVNQAITTNNVLIPKWRECLGHGGKWGRLYYLFLLPRSASLAHGSSWSRIFL